MERIQKYIKQQINELEDVEIQAIIDMDFIEIDKCLNKKSELRKVLLFVDNLIWEDAKQKLNANITNNVGSINT